LRAMLVCFFYGQLDGFFFLASGAGSGAGNQLTGIFNMFDAAKLQAFLNDFADSASLPGGSLFERTMQIVIKGYG